MPYIDLLNWIAKHWAEFAAALGIGGSSGLLAKKFTDKKQDKKINSLEKKVNSLESDIKTNTQFDKQFREQMGADYNGIKEEIGKINGRLDQILILLVKK